MWSRLFSGPVDWRPIVLALLPTLAVAWLAALLVRRLAAGALRALIGRTLAPNSRLIKGPLALVQVATCLLVSVVLLFPALDAAGLHPRVGRTLRETATWLFASGLRVMLIVLVAYALRRGTDLLVQRFELEVTQGTRLDSLERAKRAHTLGSVANKVATSIIMGIAGLMILSEMGVNVGPVLTGAGIVGVGIGFGAQPLVRDVLSGFFMILEDQVRVGDDVAINGTDGLVEQLNLRTIVLRDIRGTVHVFANGAIDTLANQSKDFSHYIIDLDISYNEDPDRVSDIARDVDRDVMNDPELARLILGPVQIQGVVGFSEWSMQLRIRLKTIPGQQWRVGREFRKRLRKALNRSGIQVPYPIVRPPA